MKHSTFEELNPVATVKATLPLSRRDIRRARLLRLADALEAHQAPIRLFTRLESMNEIESCDLRADDSPLTVAFADPLLRGEGLKSDRYGDAVKFFDLSASDAHFLLCDCHFHGGRPSSETMANRARNLANRRTLRDHWDVLRQTVIASIPASLRIR